MRPWKYWARHAQYCRAERRTSSSPTPHHSWTRERVGAFQRPSSLRPALVTAVTNLTSMRFWNKIARQTGFFAGSVCFLNLTCLHVERWCVKRGVLLSNWGMANLVSSVPITPVKRLTSVKICKGLFTWRWGTTGRWGNSLKWGNPHVHESLILIWSRLHDRWGDPPRQVAQSARPGYPLSRGQTLPCKRFKVGWPDWPGSDSWYIKFAQNSIWR